MELKKLLAGSSLNSINARKIEEKMSRPTKTIFFIMTYNLFEIEFTHYKIGLFEIGIRGSSKESQLNLLFFNRI